MVERVSSVSSGGIVPEPDLQLLRLGGGQVLLRGAGLQVLSQLAAVGARQWYAVAGASVSAPVQQLLDALADESREYVREPVRSDVRNRPPARPLSMQTTPWHSSSQVATWDEMHGASRSAHRDQPRRQTGRCPVAVRSRRGRCLPTEHDHQPHDDRENAMSTNVTPAVRMAAAQHGVSLSNVTGTGAGGRITTGDVTAAARRQAKDAVMTKPQADELAAMIGVPSADLLR